MHHSQHIQLSFSKDASTCCNAWALKSIVSNAPYGAVKIVLSAYLINV